MRIVCPIPPLSGAGRGGAWKSPAPTHRALDSAAAAHHPGLGFPRRCRYSDPGTVAAMNDIAKNAFQQRVSLLEFLGQRGWKPARDNGREEVAGLCPLHRDHHPSFYVNRRKQVFYCHGCGRGGGLARLIRLLDGFHQSTTESPAAEKLLDRTYRFYQRQLARFDEARSYLAARGI